MEKTIYTIPEEAIFNESKKIRNPIQKFKMFCERQQENRLGWAAFTMVVQVCLLVPITLITVDYNGNRFVLWIPVIISCFAIELCNLAALATKIVIPIFCICVLINVCVIILSFMT